MIFGILCIVIFCSKVNAQSTEFLLTVGFGKPYIIESIEEKKDIAIGYSPNVKLGLKFIPKSSKYWGIILSANYFESRISGITKISGTQVDGFISNTSLLLSAEREKQFRNNIKWHFISGFGIGVSHENYLFEAENIPRQNIYTSLLTYYGFLYTINENLKLRFTQELLLTDIIKGVHYLAGNWSGQSGGEDLSINILIGITYKFLK